MSMPAALPKTGSMTEKASNPIKVMVVDDSAVVRGLVSRWIEEDPALVSIARHSNGKLAVDDIGRSKPDVVVLDIEMPVMDGLTALPLLLQQSPRSKIIISSTLSRRNAEVSMKALALGATDYIAKPDSNRGVTTSADFRKELINKIKAVCPRRLKRRAPGDVAATATRILEKAPPGSQAKGLTPKGLPIMLRPFSRMPPRIFAVGSSTGGPQALLELFKSVTPALDFMPTVITQHMPATFTTILAEHIGQATGRTAKEGEDGEVLKPGCIYVAPGGHHMVLDKQGTNTVIKLTDGPQVNFCKPAVDPLFQSVAKIYGPGILAVVLTGMGHDGAAGATMIADSGGSIIAQDEETSVVWGMPGATAEAGCCSAVLPLKDIGVKVTSILKGTRV